GYGALTLQGTTRPQTADQAIALLAAEVGIQLALPIRLEATAPYRIVGLNVLPSPAADGVPLLPEVADIRSATATSLFDIGGRGMYGTAMGRGGPTVIFEAGLTDSAATWAGILPAVAAVTQVFSYDRANTTAGASDPVAGPRTANAVVDDLHALLIAAEVSGPFVFVGHSVGGIFARLFASRYPDEVVGMVLVDASHEEQDMRRQAMVPAELFATEQQFLQASNTEGIDLTASFAEMRTAAALKPMPLAVLSAGYNDPAMYPDGWPMETEAELHRELQDDLARLVPDGRLVIAEQSGHYIQQTQSDLILAAILDVLHAVSDPIYWHAQ
ncbi:MAG TPA: alpha/beta hydrolase, partial [Thermomicrobiales bacterium]|nr:alpha/beta hydrolase [Thermomicrobiales bacterium]